LLLSDRLSDDNQIEIPQSFIALFIEPGRSKPAATRFFIAQRYELCEDMANMLTQTAQEMLHALGIADSDVLQRCYQGLVAQPAVFNPAEAEWVVRRLAELSQWPQPIEIANP
jgi:hypothetical protein